MRSIRRRRRGGASRRRDQHAYAQRSAMSAIIATQHRDVVKLPRDDRRFSVITCGGKMTATQTADDPGLDGDPGEHRRALPGAAGDAGGAARRVRPVWHAAALRRAARDDRAWAKSGSRTPTRRRSTALEGFPLFTLTQALRLIGYFGGATGSEGSERAKHTVAKNAYRLRERGEPNNRIWYRKRQEILYARTERERQRWRPADKEMIVAALDRTEERVTRVIRGRRDQGRAAKRCGGGGVAAAVTVCTD